MKKLGALLLAIAVLFSLAACTSGTSSGGSASASTPGSDSASSGGMAGHDVSVTPSDQLQPTDSVPETDEPKLQGGGLISLLAGDDSYYEYDEESNNYLCSVSKPAIYLKDDAAYPQLAASLAKLNEALADSAASIRDELAASAREFLSQGQELPNLYCETRLLPVRTDSKALSILCYSSSYSGGIHGYYGVACYSYDTATGRELALEDVFTDVSGLAAELEKRLTEKYPDASFFDLSGSLNELSSQGTYNWTLGYDGVTFYFNPYDIASYADGMLTATIGFKENADMFKAEYASAPELWSQAMLMEHPQYVDLNGDGRLDEISVTASEDEYGTCTNLSITINGVTHTEDIYSFGYDLYLVHTAGGRVYLVADGNMENDYQSLRVYDLSGTEAVMTDEVMGTGLLSFYDGGPYDSMEFDGSLIRSVLLTDPADFLTGTRSNMLSTFTARASFSVTDNGKLKMLTDYYDIENVTGIYLTSKTDLTVALPADGSEVTLPAGTRFNFYRTDNSSYVDMKLDDGRVCRINVDTKNGWPIKVDGKDAEEVFDGMMFAG